MRNTCYTDYIFMTFSPVCVLLWNVSDPHFLDPVSNLRLWRNHLFVLRNFHLYEFSTLPLENYLKRIFLCIIQIKFTCQMENTVYWLMIYRGVERRGSRGSGPPHLFDRGVQHIFGPPQLFETHKFRKLHIFWRESLR